MATEQLHKRGSGAAPRLISFDPAGAAFETDTIPGEAITTDALLQSGANVITQEPEVDSLILLIREGGGRSAGLPLVYGVQFQLEGVTNQQLRWLAETSGEKLFTTDQLVAKYRKKSP